MVLGKPEKFALVSGAAQCEQAAQAVAGAIGELIPRHAREPTNVPRMPIRRRDRIL